MNFLRKTIIQTAEEGSPKEGARWAVLDRAGGGASSEWPCSPLLTPVT